MDDYLIDQPELLKKVQEQLDYLESIGCDNFQGYYFSKPIPINEIPAYNQKYL